MRKKSHVLLGQCLAEHLDSKDLRFHKKAFCFGNVLPDLKPSFVTVRHEYHVNFDMVSKKIRRLAEEFNFLEPYTSAYWRQLGEVAHYVADYFTFPHNEHFEGTIVEHTYYEGDLKDRLKAYILNGDAVQFIGKEVRFDSADEVIAFIEKEHTRYEMEQRCVEDDIRFIVGVCYQVMQGVIRVMEAAREARFTPVLVPEMV